MEDTSEQEMARLLEAALAVENDCCEFEGKEHEKQKEESIRLDRSVVSLVDRREQLGMKGDGLLARLTHTEDELELLKDEQRKHVERCDNVLRKENEELDAVKDTHQQLLTLVEIRTNPAEYVLLTPPATFDMDNFQRRKANSELWCSPAFYSHPLGYKMCFHVYPNGCGEGLGTHLSVFVAILPGEFDDILSWPFCGEITLHLLNQLQNRDHLHHTIELTDQNSLNCRQRANSKVIIDPGLAQSWGTMKMIDHYSLQVQPRAGCQYLLDDCLKLRVWKVDVLN